MSPFPRWEAPRMPRVAVLATALTLALLAWSLASPAAQEAPAGWGDVVGRVLWGKDALPEPEVLKVDKDGECCLANGPLHSDRFVVHPKNKGLRWVMVWLVDPDRKGLPIHPDYPDARKVKGTKVFVDQPRCMFEPHVLG